jgi:hypothetical protein
MELSKVNLKEMTKQIVEMITEPSLNYTHSKTQSQKIDDLLGLNALQIEKNLQGRDNLRHFSEVGMEKQLWIGLDVQGLQTPYSEILDMLKTIEPHKDEHWIDLGAGYGRMGYVMGFIFPEVKFTGYEIVAERVHEGQRILKQWGLQNAQLYCTDIAAVDFALPMADVFFIYDFGTQKDIEQCMEYLKKIAKQKKITVIARGRGIRNWIYQSHPWLFTTQEPKNFENWSLFRT